MTGMKGQTGFTLVELMIVVGIIAILAAIGFPAYSDYVVRSNRVDAQARMLQLATNLERYKSQQLSYKGVTLAMINGGSSAFPATGEAKYDLTLNLTPDGADVPTGWNLVATPAKGSPQVGDGAMVIDSQGRRCWDKADDTTCDVTDASKAWSSKAN